MLIASVRAGYALADARAKEYILHGMGRRLKILKRCLANVFEIFPPSRTQPLKHDDLNEVQISLHAFVMNLTACLRTLLGHLSFDTDLSPPWAIERRSECFSEAHNGIFRQR